MDSGQLNIEGQKELQKYFTFFNLKKNNALDDLKLDIEEFSENQVTETFYNKDDVTLIETQNINIQVINLLKKLTSQIQQSIGKDISNILRMSGVLPLILTFMPTLVTSRICKYFKISLQTFFLRKIMEEMMILEKGGHLNQDQNITQSKAVYQRLPTLDTSQQAHLEEQKKEFERVQQMNQKLQNELINAKKTTVEEENVIDNLKKQIEEMKLKYDKLVLESNKKINESQQFINLKNMIQEKNTTIKQLKEQLSKQEENL